MFIPGISPIFNLSSGIKEIPIDILCFAFILVISLRFIMILPDATLRSPARASASSLWPFPATPAMANISPERRLKETSFKASRPLSFLTCRCSTSSSTWAFSFVVFLTVLLKVLEPTTAFVRRSTVASPAGISSSTLPPFKTVIRSECSITSFILWEMKITVLPSSAIFLKVLNISLDSCGVSTAEGSSKIMISQSRHKSFIISTRCCSPTESCHTFAPGSTARPNLSENLRMVSSIFALFSMKSPLPMLRKMFSATLRVGISSKC